METRTGSAVTLAAGERYGISVTGTTLSDPGCGYNSSGTELASDRYNWDTAANLAVHGYDHRRHLLHLFGA